MDRAVASVLDVAETPFRDGLGERRPTTDATGVAREQLRIRADLTHVPAFEFALRERVSRLADFRHPYFAQTRAVERLVDADATLALVSDRLDGFRLSDLLTRAAFRGLNLDINAAICLMRQIVSAVARFHETCPDVAHGALGPERVVLTSNGRLMVTEYVLGAALEQLHFSQDRYWRELRIAVPRSAGLPRFDRRTDVTQIGVIALSLILGRALREDEYPSRVGDVVNSAKAIAPKGGFESLPPGLRTWLTRCLQLDARHSFSTAADANEELERVLVDFEYPGLPASVEEFLVRYHEADFAAAMAPVGAARESRPLDEFLPERELPRAPRVDAEAAESALDTFPTEGALSASSRAAAEPSSHLLVMPIVSPLSSSTTASVTLSSESLIGPARSSGTRDLFASAPAPTGRWKMAAVLGLVLAAGALYGPLARRFRTPPPVTPTGTLVVRTPSPGVTALLDGRAIGTTPLSVAVAAGPHTLELLSAGLTKTVPLTMTGGARIEQHVEMPMESPSGESSSPAVELSGLAAELSVAPPAPAPAKPATAPVNAPASDRGTGRVTVASDRPAPVTADVPMGVVAVNALPWAEVWVDGARVGETPIGNLALSVGTHDVLLRHPDHGEQQHTVTVTTSGVARVSVDLRR